MVSCGGGMEGIREIAWCLEGQKVLVSIGIGRGREGILSVSKHFVGVAGSETAGLGAEVEEDGVGLPLAQGLDGSLVDAGDEQGGGSA